MICPACGHAIEPSCRITPAQAAQALGSLGGSVKGDSKRRPIDYADLAKLSHAKRKANREKS